MNGLVAAAAGLGRALPSPQVLGALTAALRGRALPDAVALSALDAVAAEAPALRAHVHRLGEAWRSDTDVDGATLAAMLATAHAAAVDERAATIIEPVVTGPQSDHVPLRLTRQAFEGVAGAAVTELLVLTYSAYADPRIVAALRATAERGVRLRLLVETTHAGGGTLKYSALDALRDLPADFYVWSPARRPGGVSRPSMHAKGIVADRREAFLTSANLSGHAFDANIEVGVRIVGGELPARLRAHFMALIASGVFVPAGSGDGAPGQSAPPGHEAGH